MPWQVFLRLAVGLATLDARRLYYDMTAQLVGRSSDPSAQIVFQQVQALAHGRKPTGGVILAVKQSG